MKRKISVIFIFTFFIILQTYPFWIWSPKTQKWKNPRYSALATPKLQLEKAMGFFKKEKYSLALREFKKILVHYPDAWEASEACYYIGRCWEELKRPYQAFLAYHKLVTSYPNSKRIQEVIEREYKIGEYYLNREPKKWLGISIYDLVEHPSIEIFRSIVEDAPYSKYAAPSLYKLGLILTKLGRFDEAKEAFQKLVDTYPESEWVEAARYQLALVSVKVSGGSEYDDSARKEAMMGFKEFLEKHPDAEVSSEAEKYLKRLREEEAKKYYNIAEFYEKQRKYNSAIIYYNLLLKRFPQSEYASKAKEKLDKLATKSGGK